MTAFCCLMSCSFVVYCLPCSLSTTIASSGCLESCTMAIWMDIVIIVECCKIVCICVCCCHCVNACHSTFFDLLQGEKKFWLYHVVDINLVPMCSCGNSEKVNNFPIQEQNFNISNVQLHAESKNNNSNTDGMHIDLQFCVLAVIICAPYFVDANIFLIAPHSDGIYWVTWSFVLCIWTLIPYSAEWMHLLE